MRVRFSFLVTNLVLAGLAVGCGSSSDSPTSPSGPTAGNSTNISIVQGASTLTSSAFMPNPDTISVGDTLTWTNNDTTTHTSVSDDGTWNSGNVVPGGTYGRTFSTAGTFSYHCSLHPGMVGTVTVR